MILMIRRMLLLVSLMFWQGGFMFYGGVVVPVGARVLGSETEQGFITQSVTNYLNAAGAVCLIVILEHLWHNRRHGVGKLEWSVWSLATFSVAFLAVIHRQMDQVLSVDSSSVLDPGRFGRFHKIYIATSTLQWLASLAMLLLAVVRWKQQDGMNTEKADLNLDVRNGPRPC
jgi:hypothetical protein